MKRKEHINTSQKCIVLKHPKTKVFIDIKTMKHGGTYEKEKNLAFEETCSFNTFLLT